MAGEVPPPPQSLMRKLRLVCISDTHNASPLDGTFKLPQGDVLIHAGDLSRQGSFSELRKTVEWLEKADFQAKIVIAGNHDITLDEAFYAEHGSHFHNQQIQNPKECLELFAKAPSVTYLRHEAAVIHLSLPNGMQTTLKVFGSPYSPAHGLWAFGYPPERAPTLWGEIPLDTDVVITHTPPRTHCDESPTRGAAGCEALRQALWRTRPRVAICGHVHEGRGAERVRWSFENGIEESTWQWVDPGKDNKKKSIIDLTAKADRALATVGSSPSAAATWSESNSRQSHRFASSAASDASNHDDQIGQRCQGGLPNARLCDLAALSGPTCRKETCIVNAALMASSWPYKSGGGKKYNKPIVVDIDLPNEKSS
ncbi:MAG: hypothetical protein M1819_003840 [Sarea resinae]|nr:MAG: hypothetical protein M1819_003840 [Sarea resinae]